MKSLKSLFAMLALVSVTFACASVTDASISDAPDVDGTEITAPGDDAVFNGADDPEPILPRPKI